MPEVISIHSFEHNGTKRRGGIWHASDVEAKALVRAGLVQLRDNTAIPPEGSGKKSSASPAAPASPKQTSKKSKHGGKKNPGE